MPIFCTTMQNGERVEVHEGATLRLGSTLAPKGVLQKPKRVVVTSQYQSPDQPASSNLQSLPRQEQPQQQQQQQEEESQQPVQEPS